MLQPLPSSRWNEQTATHLLNRAGFGGGTTEIKNLTAMGMNNAVSWFINYEKIPDNTPLPDCSTPDVDLMAKRNAIRNAVDLETKKELQRMENLESRRSLGDLRYWWLRRMALGPRPLQEKMTLFWHGHFATSFEKVRRPFLLWQQNDTLRQNATGKFGELLQAVAKDPAMLLYLDGARSNKNHPNENFAREVMELFTLGEGHYTEKDIQESARAYTGWSLAKDQVHYEFHSNAHDKNPKTFLGQTGNFSGEDALDIICAQPQCAKFICGKLWRFFAQDEPPQPVIDALADNFIKSGLDLKSLLGQMFRSTEFYAPEVIGSQIKSPVQWLVGSSNSLETSLPTQAMSLVMLSSMGQDLFAPPNVKGWDGGIGWITTNSLLDRYNFAAALVEGQQVPLPIMQAHMRQTLGEMEKDALLQTLPPDVHSLFTTPELGDPNSFLAAVEKRFLSIPLKPQRRDPIRDFLKTRSPLEDVDIRQTIRLVMSTPEYQLT